MYNTPDPLAYGQTLQVLNDTTQTINLTSSVATNEAAVYTVTAQPQHGTLSGTAPNLVYQPDNAYIGDDEIQFTVTVDGQTSAPAVIQLVVRESQATLPSVWSNLVSGIQIDGNFTDWSSVTPFSADAEDINVNLSLIHI